jgi:hypothetical protein
MPSLDEIQAALARCITAEPPSKKELQLSPDSSQLAEVFAEMVYAKEQEREITELNAAQREAFDRWSK